MQNSVGFIGDAKQLFPSAQIDTKFKHGDVKCGITESRPFGGAPFGATTPRAFAVDTARAKGSPP